jgi:hypothetical protein
MAVASRKRTASRFFFHQGIFTKNNMTIVLTRLTFLFPRLQIKLKGRHFDTIEVIEAESQAVQNNLTENDLKNDRSSGNGAYVRNGTISRVMVASRPKVTFRLVAHCLNRLRSCLPLIIKKYKLWNTIKRNGLIATIQQEEQYIKSKLAGTKINKN